jgi:hypothetical protein
VKSLTPTPPSEPLKPSTGAAVRDHRNAVRDRSESLSAIDRNRCPHSPESALFASRAILVASWASRESVSARAGAAAMASDFGMNSAGLENSTGSRRWAR